jgi:uncharacterized protein (TIGR02099 family)
VRIYDAEGREALRLPSVDNILAWRSLLHRDLRLHSVVIDGPKLTVRRDASGVLEVAGFRVGGGDGGFAAWLLGQGDVEIRNAEIEWRDERRQAPPLVLSRVTLHLRNDAARHAVGLTARLPAQLGEHLDLRAELGGAQLDERLRGRLYAEIGYADLAAWGAWVDLPAGFVRGAGALRAWTTIENGAVDAATADFAVSDAAVVLRENLPALELDSVGGRVHVRALADGYQLTGRQLAIRPAGAAPIGPADLQLAWQKDGGALSANVVDIAALARLLPELPVPDELRRLVDELEPRGQLADASFQWRGATAAPQRYRARARFADLGLNARGTTPGFSGLSGSVEANEGGGRAYLQSRHTVVDMPRVFSERRLPFDSLSGQVDWQLEPGRFSLRLTSVSFANADLSGSLFGAYTRADSGPGSIDLSGTLTRADARRIARYLPLARIMGEKPRAWLVAGIVQGQASDVHLRLRGNLKDFPFADPATGQFLVTARVQNGVLNYADGWPRIEAIDGDLRFERTGMDIAGRSGRILGARLANVRVSIPNLDSRDPQLSLSGEASGPTGEFLKYIAASPVRRMTDGFTDAMEASGSGRLRLGLELPLARLDDSRVTGEYEFAANTVRLHPRLAPVEQASGRLSFSEASFAAQDVHGRLLGGPIAISGGTRGKGAMEFSANGDLPAQALGALPEPLRRRLSGHAAYAAKVALNDGAMRLVVDSSLRGLASALPAPLAKSADQPLPLHLEVHTTDAGARERVLAGLGKLVAVEALREARNGQVELQRAGVRFTPRAGETVRLPAKGLSLQGALAELDVDAWRALGGTATPTAPPGDMLLDLKLARLQAYGRRLDNVTLRASTTPQGWSAMVSADQLEGELGYRAEDGGRLVARLARIDVPPESGTGRLAGAFKPGSLPAVDFAAERFTVRGKELGRVELAAHPEGEDWRIEKLAITNDEASLRGSAWWRGAGETALDFSLQSRDAGSLLGRLGYAGLIAGGTTRLEGKVSWPGEPFAFDGAGLSGELRLNARDGQFLEIEPGIGKLISLMSLQALPRRIALDFRDVFSKGFRFDRVDAASQLERGRMRIREFQMRGSAAEVEMSGEVNLAAETQDLRVRVVPGLGDSASTAIAAIVNPVAGVTAALAQRMLKNPLGQIFAHEFSVTGGWAEPQVARLNPPEPPGHPQVQ